MDILYPIEVSGSISNRIKSIHLKDRERLLSALNGYLCVSFVVMIAYIGTLYATWEREDVVENRNPIGLL